MESVKHKFPNWFPEGYLHSFSQQMSAAYRSSKNFVNTTYTNTYTRSADLISAAYRSSTRGIISGYTRSAGFLRRKRLPIALASIPTGILLAATKCNVLQEIGYTTIGGGVIELLTEIRDRKARRRIEQEMKRFNKEEIKGIVAIQKENEELRIELTKLKKEVHAIRKLEEKEMEILKGTHK